MHLRYAPLLVVCLMPVATLALAADAIDRGRLPRIDGYGDPLPEGALARFGTVRFRHCGSVSAVAWSPDGAVLASSGDSQVHLWDATTGRELRCLDAPSQHSVLDIAFSRDGRRVAGCCTDGLTYVWDSHSGRLVRRLGKETQYGGRLAFSPDDKLLATSAGGPVRVFSTDTWQELMKVEDGSEGFVCVAFTPDSMHLVTAVWDTRIRLWDLSKSGRFRWLRSPEQRGQNRSVESHARRVSSVAVSPDGRWLALADGADCSVTLTDIRSREQGWTVRLPRSAYRPYLSACFSADGRMLAVAGGGCLCLLDADTGKQIRDLAAPTDEFWGVAFSPTGQLLAIGWYNAVRLFNVPRGQEIVRAEGPHEPAWTVTFSPRGNLLAATYGGQASVYDLTTRREVRRLRMERGRLVGAHFSLDGRQLVTDDMQSQLRVWDMSTGKLLQAVSILAGQQTIRWSKVTPDLKTVLVWRVGAERGATALRVCDAATGRELLRVPRDAERPGVAAISLNSHLVAVGQPRSPIRVFNVAGGREVCCFRDGGSHGHLEFARDGRSVGVLDDDGVFRLWEVSNGQLRCWIKSHVHTGRFQFNRDGSVVAIWPSWEAGSVQKDPVMLWELRTGALIGRLHGHQCTVTSVDFSFDGTHLATGSMDSTVLLWDLAAVIGDRRRAHARLVGRDLDRLWNDLAGADSAQAYQAISALLDTPAQAVAYLGTRLRPVHGPKLEAINRLLSDLDSSDFNIRERATKELEQQAELVASRLRQALEAGPSPEARRRLERVLAVADKSDWDTASLRILRATEVLEGIGTPAAKKILHTMAEGAPGARITQEAKASLERLAQQP